MKIVVQIHNHKTYICSNSDNAQQEVKKNFLSINIAAGYRKRVPKIETLNTFFNNETKGSHSFQDTSPVIFSWSDGSVLSINVTETSLIKQLWLLLQKCGLCILAAFAFFTLRTAVIPYLFTILNTSHF